MAFMPQEPVFLFGYFHLDIFKWFIPRLNSGEDGTNVEKAAAVALVSGFSPLRGIQKSGDHSDWNIGPFTQRPPKHQS
ncbi:hypothetical protein ACFSQ7_34880 [Paenibacillus rhizoplanae]